MLPYTMLSVTRLENLLSLTRRVDELKIEGDLVECGTWNGGSGAILARGANLSPFPRHVWLLDSFLGMPVPGARDDSRAARYAGLCRGDPQKVRRVLRLMAVREGTATVVEGLFQETLGRIPVRQIALLHLDADWYDSVRFVLETLYDKIAPGGFVVLDDFGYWKGCREAFSDFTQANKVSAILRRVDETAVYFQKKP